MAFRSEPVLPNGPVTLSVDEIRELNQQLSDMRHDINNCLSVIMALVELAKFKPDAVPRLISSVGEQPGKVASAMKRFSAEFERTLKLQSKPAAAEAPAPPTTPA